MGLEVKENKMGVLPIKKLILSMALPMMISMLGQALYNIVDSIFVAKINENALNAVSLSFPLQTLMISLGSGTGVGVNALLSKALGEKKFDRANAAADNGLFLTLISYFVFLGLGIFAVKPFFLTQTSHEQIVSYGVDYLSICCCFSLGLFFQMMFERLLQSTGNTLYSMISQMSGAIVNIIMDPILIFGYFGFPRLEVKGAAIATVIGQFAAACIGLILNIKFNKEIKLSLKGMFKPDLKIIKIIYVVGIPSILMMSIGSVMTYLMNRILLTFTATATAVFGVYFKLQSFFFMPVFGLNNGLIPVLAYNYGARNKERIREALEFAMMLAVGVMLVGLVIFETIPDVLLKMFNASDKMMDMGKVALRTMCLSFPFAGLCIAMGSVFQAFSKSIYSLIISVGRQLVILIPAAYLLSLLGNVNYVWWSFPIAEIASVILSVFFYRKVHREIVDKL